MKRRLTYQANWGVGICNFVPLTATREESYQGTLPQKITPPLSRGKLSTLLLVFYNPPDRSRANPLFFLLPSELPDHRTNVSHFNTDMKFMQMPNRRRLYLQAKIPAAIFVFTGISCQKRFPGKVEEYLKRYKRDLYEKLLSEGILRVG